MGAPGTTPGPWHTGADGRIVYSSEGWAVSNAVTFHQKHHGDEDLANAHQIAASPALYDALEAIDRHVSHAKMGDWSIALDEIRKEARAALRLARGEGA